MVAVRMEGFRTVRADRRAVWDALTNVDDLKLCISGCDALFPLSATRFGVAVTVSLGPVRIPFQGSVEIKGSDPLRSYHIAGRGKGGLVGTATGSATVRLSDVPSGCRLGYVIDAEPDGPLAALGAFFISGVARTLTDRFLANFADRLEQPAGAPGSGAERDRPHW